MELNGLPYVYQIEPTNACPYRCYMCPRGSGKMERPVGFMPLKSLERVLEQIPAHQRMLRLHHFGEPTLHPDILSFIRLTRLYGIIPAVSLNPSSLTEEMIDGLIDSGIGIVCFSLDSLDSARLNAIRGITKPATYCLGMIDYFIKKSRNAQYPVYKVIQMVSLTANKDEQQSFLALKEKYPEEDVYVYISANYGFGDAELINETCRDETGTLSTGGFPCSAPFDDIVILWNGDIVLCCYDYDGCNIIGNINEDAIVDIWNGEKIINIRDIFNKAETFRLPLCGKCYLAPHNYPGKQIAKTGRGSLEEKHILNLYPPFRELNRGR